MGIACCFGHAMKIYEYEDEYDFSFDINNKKYDIIIDIKKDTIIVNNGYDKPLLIGKYSDWNITPENGEEFLNKILKQKAFL